MSDRLELPFKPGDRVIELGGGETPELRHFGVQNVDFRKLPTVDIVADLNRTLPFSVESYEGVFSKFLLEHVSWRQVRPLVQEIHRILTPGGIAVLITSNTLEQCRVLASKSKWDESDICMLFGDQNYNGGDWVFNAHHAGFSPEYAERLFHDCGFYGVKTYPLPYCTTDLVIEAHKSKARITPWIL